MVKLKLVNTIFSKLGSLSKNDGQIVVSSDSKSLYVDLKGERIEVTDWIDVDTEEKLLAILSPLVNKYYYTKDTNKIWRYIGGKWECLNTSVNDLTPTYTESSTLAKLSSGEKLSVSFGKISKAITDLISHIGDSVKHITSTERINWGNAYTHSQSTHARTDATKVEKSATNGNIKINGNETNVYTHPSGTNPHGTTKSDVGLGNVGNFKAVSTVANQGLTDAEKSNARANIGAGTSSFSGSYNDLTNKPTIPSVGNGTITIKQAGTSKGTFTMNQSGNTTIELTDNNTTYGVATSSALGLVKSGTDITVDSSGNVSVNDDSHNHVISNVDGLQSALDGKSATGHTHDDRYYTESEIDSKLSGKANSSHGTHVPSVCTTITDWNSATSNGWYMASNASNQPVSNGGWFYGVAIVHNSNYIRQIAWHFATDNSVAGTNCDKYERVKHNGTWGSWVNTSVRVAVPSNAKFTDTNTWRPLGTTADTACAGNDARLSNSRPASDVYAWAKASSKPSYSWSEITSKPSTFTPSSHTHSYAGSSSTGGSATSAVKLDSSAGSATQPVYFSGGKPVACTYTLGKSVPSNAVFTDTNTWRGIQNNLTSDSTTDSLSAAQGKVLKGLVDGKAASMISYCPSTSSAGVSKTVTIKGNFYNSGTSWYIQDLVRFTFYKVKLKSTSSYGGGVYSYCVYSLSNDDIWLDTSGETSLVGISTSINDRTTSNGVVERTITLKLTLGSYGWFNIEYNSSKYKVTIV